MAVVKRFRYLAHPKASLAGIGVNLDIDGWLRGIGLGQYIELFRANDIDGELLGRLTGDDLKEIVLRPLATAASCCRLLLRSVQS